MIKPTTLTLVPTPDEPLKLRDYQVRTEARDLIGLCRNSFGEPLGRVAKELLRCAIEWPSDDSWDEAHGVIIAPRLTLWEALLSYTDYNQRESPHYIATTTREGAMRVVRTKWALIPTSRQMLDALSLAVTPPTRIN